MKMPFSSHLERKRIIFNFFSAFHLLPRQRLKQLNLTIARLKLSNYFGARCFRCHFVSHGRCLQISGLYYRNSFIYSLYVECKCLNYVKYYYSTTLFNLCFIPSSQRISGPTKSACLFNDDRYSKLEVLNVVFYFTRASYLISHYIFSTLP